MRYVKSSFWLLLLFLVVPCFAQVPPHPRLLIDSERITELRNLSHPTEPNPTNWTDQEKVAVLAYRSIVTQANYWVDRPVSDFNLQGKRIQSIMSLCMGHILRGDPAQEPEYEGQYADKVINEVLPAWSNVWPCGNDNDLCNGEILAAYAIAVDWLYSGIPRPIVYNLYIRMLDHHNALRYDLYGDNHKWYQCRDDNNHIGIDFGGLGLAALALEGDPCLGLVGEAERYDAQINAARRVKDYLDASFQGDGSGVEGLMYAMYGLHIALPFALAIDGLDHLDPEEKVHFTTERCAQQAGNWLVYEQLPYQPSAGTPLNDTAAPPTDLNHTQWRSWPWLMAGVNADRPSAARHLFLTHYPQDAWDDALDPAIPFDPDATNNPLEGILFSHRTWNEGGYCSACYNAVAILLSYPGPDAPPEAFLDPDTMMPSTFFDGRGILFYRTALHDVVNGQVVTEPDGALIAFICRNKALWSQYPPCSGLYVPGSHHGHAHFDVNHFVLYAYGAPLFWDSGLATSTQEFNISRRAEAHNLCEIQISGQWKGGGSWGYREGEMLHAIIGVGQAPTVACGDQLNMWGKAAYYPYPPERDQRHFFILPRDEGEAPYVLFYDDIEVNDALQSAHMRWHWQSANNQTDGPFEPEADFQRATICKDDAAATTTILSPDLPENGGGLNPDYPFVNQWLETYKTWARHYRLTTYLGDRENADLVALIEAYDTGGNCQIPPPLTLTSEVLTTSLPGASFAYLITDNAADRADVIAMRRGDQSGEWTIDVDGREIVTDAQHIILRFSDTTLDWTSIEAGTMIAGKYATYDDQIVITTNAMGSDTADITFSPEEVTIVFKSPLPYLISYLIGPVIPLVQRINDSDPIPTTMMDRPHPLMTEFDNEAVGRSPKNDLVKEQFQYSVRALLRNWAGDPVVGWQTAKATMDIHPPCPNPSSGNPTELPSDSEGHVIWLKGLTTGGSYEVTGGPAVSFWIDYGAAGFCRIKAYPWIISPDEDADGDIDLLDQMTWQGAYTAGEPLYLGDMNLDLLIDMYDYAWFQQHYYAQ